MSNFSIILFLSCLPLSHYIHQNILQLRVIEQETSKAGLEIQLCKLMIEQDQVYMQYQT